MRLFAVLTVCCLLLGTTHAGAQAPVKPVEVVNLPETQTVDGTVEVSNFPAVQDVSVVDPLMCDAPTSSQLVGFTNATFLGDEGVLGFTLACQADFPDSKVCTSAEVAETVSTPALSGEAWVRPVLLSGASSFFAVEIVSGLRLDSDDFTCGGYSRTDRSGFVVDAGGPVPNRRVQRFSIGRLLRRGAVDRSS